MAGGHSACAGFRAAHLHRGSAPGQAAQSL